MFADRAEAGRLLAARLADHDLTDPVVLALPRGGVPVGFEVAKALGAPLDVLAVRKIGAPFQPELGVGAVAEGGEPVFDHRLRAELGLTDADLDETVRRERRELERRTRTYRRGRPPTPLSGRDAIVVDDGLATGVTARAALRAVRERQARRVVLAVPVCPPGALEALAAEADVVICLRQPEQFVAVGQWYRDFAQVDDDEVIALLSPPPAIGRAARR